VPPGEFTGDLLVTFLLPGGVPYTTVPGDSLKWQIANGSLVTATRVDAFTFRLEGVTEGMTTVTLILWATDHVVYSSPPIEVHVEEGHAEADGLILRKNGNVLLSVFQGVVTGSVNVPLGGQTDPITLTFLDPKGDEFTPEGSDFSMVGTPENPAVMSFTPTGDWEFRLDGLAAGPTTFQLCVFHVDHCDYTSPDLPAQVLTVTDAPLPVAAPAFDLRPASPNPLVAETTIAFSLPAASSIDLAVYDAAGRRVATLANGARDAGTHTVSWRPRAANGVYFVRLATSSGTRIEKDVVTR
jgi:hypothetical protein